MKRIKLRIWIVNAGVCLLSAAAFAGETPFDKMQLKGRTDKGTVPDHMRKIISIAVQFQMMPAEHSGLAFRNFRLEEAE